MKKLLLLSIAFLAISGSVVAQDLYSVGEIIDLNGVKAYVYKVTANGRHGMAVTIDGVSAKKWCTDKVALKAVINTTASDGKANMKAFEDYCSQNGKDISIFPAIKWCKDLGEGWYIPSADELKEVETALFVAPAGEEDDSAGEDEGDTMNQSAVAQSEVSGGLITNFKDYTIKYQRKSKKHRDNTSKLFKKEGGDDYLKAYNAGEAILSSTASGSLPLKWAMKYGKDVKAGVADAYSKYAQYEVPIIYMYHCQTYNQGLIVIPISMNLGTVTVKNIGVFAPVVRAITEF